MAACSRNKTTGSADHLDCPPLQDSGDEEKLPQKLNSSKPSSKSCSTACTGKSTTKLPVDVNEEQIKKCSGGSSAVRDEPSRKEKVTSKTAVDRVAMRGQKKDAASKSKKPSTRQVVSGRRRVLRKKPTGEHSLTSRQDTQQTMRDYFPVRRSTRRCKSVVENDQLQTITRKLLSKDEEGLEAVEIEEKGKGVISTRPFTKGELICEYSGELVSYEEAKEREEQYQRNPSIGCYMYYFEYKNKKLCVDATKDNGRFGRLLNHSKTASNVVTKLLPVDDHPYLCLMAARDILVGEELQYDYGERSKDALQSHPWLAK